MRLSIFFLLTFILLSSVACQTRTRSQSLELDENADPAKIILPDKATSPAVISLLNQAKRASNAKQYSKSEVLLERALRIEPRNATLWHYLAKLRLHQGQLDEAAGFAGRSNTMIRNDDKLRAENWKIIAHVRQQQGDANAAGKARLQVERLLRR